MHAGTADALGIGFVAYLRGSPAGMSLCRWRCHKIDIYRVRGSIMLNPQWEDNEREETQT